MDRLRMPVTIDDSSSAEDLKRRIMEEGQKPSSDDDAKDPKLDRVYSFPFSFVSGHRKWEGQFTNRALNVNQRMLAGQLTSDLIGNRPMNSIPGSARELAVAVGWMTFSLTERPPWADDLSEIDDELVILRLYGEVWSHQSRFLGRKDDSESQTSTD